MLYKGVLNKMGFKNLGSQFDVTPQYFLALGKEQLDISAYIGNTLKLTFTGRLECIGCGKTTKSSFGQGYCYPCFTTSPHTEECVLRPELCQAHRGVARDLDYARDSCLVEQYVYLALSGGLKVGVTRHHQVPIRWVDQGATQVLPILSAPNRYNAGLAEVALKDIFADKTNWRRMLRGDDGDEDLLQARAVALQHIRGRDFNCAALDSPVYRIRYPIKNFPPRVTPINLSKTPSVTGKLLGIKGQYLFFDNGEVLNVRSHSGFEVDIELAASVA